jgi:hypothetical protein
LSQLMHNLLAYFNSKTESPTSDFEQTFLGALVLIEYGFNQSVYIHSFTACR